jgi:hypothetical protein
MINGGVSTQTFALAHLLETNLEMADASEIGD